MDTVTQKDILNFLTLIRPVKIPISYARIGNQRDGGYIIPSDYFKRVDAVISVGISDDDSFEMSCVKMGLPVHAFDPTINEPPTRHSSVYFYREAFGSYENKFHNSLDNLLGKTSLSGKKTLFKFDVEGAEWPGFFYTSHEALKNVQILVGEFHELRQLASRGTLDLFHSVMQKISTQFYPVVVTANNVNQFAQINGICIPNLLEITFINKDYFNLVGSPVYQLGPNHCLSNATDPAKDDYLWNPSWYLLNDYS